MGARLHLEQWVIEKLEPLRSEARIVLRDPQRMIQRDARAVDGWAEENGFNVLICTGNISFREWYESIRDDKTVKLLLVDQTRDPDTKRRNISPPVFCPDFVAETKSKARLRITLQDYLAQATDDSRWPEMVNERNLSRIILANLDATIEAHRCLRRVDESRFRDTDLFKIVLGAMLDIDPFRKPTSAEIRRLCIEQYDRLEEVQRTLPSEVTSVLIEAIENAEPPFCWLLKRDPEDVIMAFTLSLLLSQYDHLDPKLLLANFDPALSEYREISQETLNRAGKELIEADPDRLAADISHLERFLLDDPKRVKLLFGDLLKVHQRADAIKVLKTERFSSLIRTVALAALLADFLANKGLELHGDVLDILAKDEQSEFPKDLFDKKTQPPLALRRPTDGWTLLKDTYRRAHEVMSLAAKTDSIARRLSVVQTTDLTFDEFDQSWRDDGLCKLDFYLSDLGRALRLDQGNPLPRRLQWEEFTRLCDKARERFKVDEQNILKDLAKLHKRFQDLYATRYVSWINDSDAPVIFTHQFVPRFLKSHWDPLKGPKVYILIFDGMRVDAWQEFLLPVLAERFEVVEERPGSAILPTETNLTRKAISAGCLPKDFVSTKENALLEAAVKKYLGYDLRLSVDKNDEDEAAGVTIRYSSDRMEVVIFNFTDKKLHNETSDLAFVYRQTVQAIISQDVRSVLRQIEDDALVFVTSDHGFIPTSNKGLRISEEDIADNRDVKSLNARLQKKLVGRLSNETVQFEAGDLGIPTQTKKGCTFTHIAFPRPGFTFRRPKYPRDPDRYTHGGLSLAECLIPMVCLGPKSGRDLPIHIENFMIQGSLMEGDEVTLILDVAGSAQNTRVLIDVDQAVIQERTEMFTGGQKTYRINWTLPVVEKPERDEIEAGAARRLVTATVRYHHKGKSFRTSKSIDVKIRLDRNRLRRRVSSKLDMLLGMMPKGLR